MPPSVPTPQPDIVRTEAKRDSLKSADTTVKSTEKYTNGNTNGTSNGDARKITILRDVVRQSTATFRSELGHSADDFLSGCDTIEQFFDFVAGIRLRQVPHHSSTWDKVLKWAEFFAVQVYGYSEETSQFATYSDRAASIIWACCRSLLKLGPENVVILEKAFGTFYGCGLTLGFFLRHHGLLHHNEELQLVLVNCYTDLLKLVTGVTLYYSRKERNTKFSTRAFDEQFSRSIDSFFSHSDRFTDTIWSVKLETVSKSGDVSIELLRDFLSPHDRITSQLTSTQNIRKTRANFTCEWFDNQLSDFMRGGKEILVVSGKPRTGKSFLSDWTVERLQTLSGRRASEVVSHTIDSDLKNELTALSVVKGLLLQVLRLSAGNSDLYKSLLHAYELSRKGSPTSQIENALWTALQVGFANDRNHTVVIDGVDQLKNGEADVAKLFGHLDSIATRKSKLKIILFSRTLSSSITQKHAHFAVTAEHTRQDIQYFIQSLLFSSPFSDVLSEKDKPIVTTKLTETSGGSFEWIVQAIDILKTETTSAGILKKLEILPRTLDAIIEQVISTVDLKQRDTKSLLAWMLVSQRPLLLAEIKQLFEIDTANNTRSPRHTGIDEDVVKALGPLVTIRDGFARFSNPIIKQVLEHRAATVTDFKNTGAFPFHIKEAHYDLTMRSLVYIKMTLTRPTQPTLSPLNDYELDGLFSRYDLLQYATRYWAWHFEASPMHEPTVQHKITQGFRAVLPHSTILSLIEGSCFQYQSTYQDAFDHHLLTLSLRRMIIGDNSEPVLQNFLNLSVLKESTLHPGEVNEYFYEAWKIATTLKLTAIATTCAHRYIERTSTITITTKSTTAVRRSEMLEYIITIYRETRVSQTEILTYLEMLVTIYVVIGETEKVTKLRREIYEMHVRIYGRSASQTERAHGELVTTVSKSTKTEEVQEMIESNYHEASRTLPVTDPKRLDLSWKMIEIYTKRNDTSRVEELLVWLWQSWTHHSHPLKDTKTQQQRIDIALRYVTFLKTHDRTAEAENILRGVAIDLENTETDDEEIIKRTKIIGNELVSVGSVTAARGIFARLWEYYVRTGKTNTSEAKSVSTTLEETTSHSITETTTETTTLRQIFDTIITKTTTKTIDTRVVHTSLTLIETYYSEQGWEEVIRVSTVTLTHLWTGWTSPEFRTPLPSNYLEETITIIRRLFTSHWKLRQTSEAETTLRKFFYAVLSTPKSTDELLLSVTKDLNDFYEAHGMIEKEVVIYADLYAELEKRKGKTDSWTIRTLYAMGDASMRVNDLKNAEFAYHTIHVNLCSEICHRDGIRASQILITIYEQQRQYENARKIYQSIWQMFIKHGKEYELKPDWFEDLYEKLVRNLKQDRNVQYKTLRQFAIDYRKALVRFCGIGHESTIKATLSLAEINEGKAEHREDAIALYEEADNKTRDLPKGQISQSTLNSVINHRRRLPHLYSISQLSTSPKSIPLYEQEWQTYHTKNGHSHGDSLKWLALLVVALAKQDAPESKAKAASTTLTSVTEVVKKEKNSQRLWDSGSGLANVYLKAGMKTEGEHVLQQLRSQVIFGDSNMTQSLGLTPSSNLDRRIWVFIVTFQSTLHGTKHANTIIMADLVNEVFLYAAYRRVVSQKAPFLESLAYGSRLLKFMRDIQDWPSHTRVERELLEYFVASLSAPNTINSSVIHQFFKMVLAKVQQKDLDTTTLKAGSAAVVSYAEKGHYVEAHDMAFLVDRFQQFVGGYGSVEKVGYGLHMALSVAGYKKTKVTDDKLKKSMLDLANNITKQLVQEARAGNVLIVDIPLKDLNTASGLLGELGNLDDLEYILTILWNARTTQTSWPAATIVSLGRRLAETQFARSHHASAIQLCEDMCYNLRRVWGALDVTTLDMHILLSEFLTSSQQYRNAMQVHENVLRDTVSDKGEELKPAEAAAIAVQHLELLKRAYQRLGGWDKDPQVYIDLYQQLLHIFGSEENWKKAHLQGVEKWAPKGVDSVGVWVRPGNFEWMESEAQRKHANYLRMKLRGGVDWASSHIHGGRLTRSYSGRSIAAK